MNEQRLLELLQSVKMNEISLEAAVAKLKELPYDNLGFAKIDYHRQL